MSLFGDAIISGCQSPSDDIRQNAGSVVRDLNKFHADWNERHAIARVTYASGRCQYVTSEAVLQDIVSRTQGITVERFEEGANGANR